jgi:hypothetical protein
MTKVLVAICAVLASNGCFAEIITGNDFATPLKYCLGTNPPDLSVAENLQYTIASYISDARCEVNNVTTCISSYGVDEFKVKWVSPCRGLSEDTFRCDDYNCWHMAT